MSILNPPTQKRRALVNFHGGGKNKCNVLNGSIVGIKQSKQVRFGYITTVTEIFKIKALSAKPSEYHGKNESLHIQGLIRTSAWQRGSVLWLPFILDCGCFHPWPSKF